MKVQKTKIKPQLFAVIKDVADQLPPMAKFHGGQPVYRTKAVKGSELTKEDVKPGTPINPDMMYKLNVLVYEQHEANLVAGVKKHGVMYIQDYRDSIMAQYKAFQVADAKARKATSRIKNLLNKIIPWKKKNL